MNEEYITIDKIKWWVWKNIAGIRNVQPLCPKHKLRLRPVEDTFSNQYNFTILSRTLKCEDCKKAYKIPRGFASEQKYVIDRLDAQVFKTMKFINLDDQALPIAEHKISKSSKYFVTSVLTKSKVGLRLVVYAGKKGEKEKTQIFVEPEIKRLAFDQANLHPTDVFTKLEATFSDGSKTSIKKNKIRV